MSRIYQNHVVDPTFFYDAIEQFAFDYDWIVQSDRNIDDYGRLTFEYTNKVIRGSLQSQGVRLNQSKEGNREEMTYNFYCKSLFRIKIGDFILYKNRLLRVNDVEDFDEYGVRQCSLTMVQLTEYKDLEEYLKYLNGEILV